MKNHFFLIALIAFSLLSFKEKPIAVNKDFLGTYVTADSAVVKTWTLKLSPGTENKIDFYADTDKESKFTVVMKDSTHFKTTHDYIETTAAQTNHYWSAKGAFLNNGKMELKLHVSDVSAGLKISISMEEDPTVVFSKK